MRTLVRLEKMHMSDMEQKLKKVYEAPQITKVTLKPEEAVLSACKTPSVGGGPTGNSCNANQCQAQGS